MLIWPLFLALLLHAGNAGGQERSALPPAPGDIRVLYMVPYAHLDTQWLWDYKTTIDEHLKKTLDDNFALFQKYPDYKFNFTGSFRYHLMKEYYPAAYEELKRYIREGRWFVAGSSVDEGDVLMASPESVLRHILLANQFFRREFGRESYDYMLPDSFGFPQSLPTLASHAGLLGFSTQKLELWGAAVTPPFAVGYWRGLDQSLLLCALKPGPYDGSVPQKPHENKAWMERLSAQCDHNFCFDFRYFGIGDKGGAPREKDIQNVAASMANASPIKVKFASSDQMFKDLAGRGPLALGVYQGDFLLTEHSTGSLSSRAYIKKLNRYNEALADATEKIQSFAFLDQADGRPPEQWNMAWEKVLASQMHDILAGTCFEKAYEYAYNDEIIAANLFKGEMRFALDSVARGMDTLTEGIPILAYNPVCRERQTLLSVQIPIGEAGEAMVARAPDGTLVPAQIEISGGPTARVLWQAKLKPLSVTLFSLEKKAAGPLGHTTLAITEKTLENEYLSIHLDPQGNIVSIFDKEKGTEVLAAPIRYHFQREYPREYPSWNMDWKDRIKFPYTYLGGPAKAAIMERGPVRVSLQIERRGMGSTFRHTIALTQGSRLIQFDENIDWHTTDTSLKVAFPLTVTNRYATYTNGLNPVERPTNHPKQYEVPSQMWFDLSRKDLSYGVSVIESGKYGSDKPLDNMLRLTLLYTPHTTPAFGMEFGSRQDWGRHHISYALYPHDKSYKEALTPWLAKEFNTPVQTFVLRKHPGQSPREISFFTTPADNIGVSAIKIAEDGSGLIFRLHEMNGLPQKSYRLTFPAEIKSVEKTDGQERPLLQIPFSHRQVDLIIHPFALTSLKVTFAQKPARLSSTAKTEGLALPFDSDVVVENGKTDAAMGEKGAGFPAEIWPQTIKSQGVLFTMGPAAAGLNNAVWARGQTIHLPARARELHLLASADHDLIAHFTVDGHDVSSYVPAWHGKLVAINPQTTLWNGQQGIGQSFVKSAQLAYFFSHRHKDGADDAYEHAYLFHLVIPLTGEGRSIKLPDAKELKILAAAVKFETSTLLYDTKEIFSDLAIFDPSRGN